MLKSFRPSLQAVTQSWLSFISLREHVHHHDAPKFSHTKYPLPGGYNRTHPWSFFARLRRHIPRREAQTCVSSSIHIEYHRSGECARKRPWYVLFLDILYSTDMRKQRQSGTTCSCWLASASCWCGLGYSGASFGINMAYR